MSKRGNMLKSTTATPLLKAGEEQQIKALFAARGLRAVKSHPHIGRELLKRGGARKIDRALKLLIEGGFHASAIAQWEAFYQKHFDLTVDLSQVKIPRAPAEFSRLIIVAQGVTLNQAMAACKKRFPTWQYANDLDESITHNDRSAKDGAYAIWARDRIEADEDMADKSADQLRVDGVQGITLLERILLELEHFERTGGHLDIQNITLCSGSRRGDGGVPRAGWGGGTFHVYWYHPVSRGPFLRARVVVS